MGAGHEHGSEHAQGGATGAQNRKRLTVVLGLAATYMVAEVIGGLLTNSLALLADAGHMLSDVASLALSLFALWIARRPATPQHTFGYYRTEILAALVNGATLIAISIYIFYEAFHRFGEPPEVQGALMMVIAFGGLLINLIGLRILSAGKEESLNIRGAWLHVMADALGSIGAIAAGALIWIFGWNWADPVASVLIGLLVLIASWNLLKETVLVLMEGAPGRIDMDELRNTIRSVPGVRGVHHLHVWTITSGMVALSAHVVVEAERFDQRVLREVNRPLHDRFGIAHTTIQLEPEGLTEPDVAF
jgi:cobalt-zinc-cadmium efflux system protein